MKDLFLVADIGTSSCKSALIRNDGRIVDSIVKEYPTYYPKLLFVEHNPTDWWQAFSTSTKELIKKNPCGAERIIGVSISGNTPSVLPVDRYGKPLHNAIIWMDRRSEKECRWLEKNKDKIPITELTTNRLESFYPLPKLVWLKRHNPELFNDTYKFLQSNGYIVHKLTGKFSIDISHCAMLLLYDVWQEKWSDTICDFIGLDINKLPQIYRSPEIVGVVTKEASEATYLSEGTPVIAGFNDGAASSLGVGMIVDGQSYVVMGQAGGIAVCTDTIPTQGSFVNYHYGIDKLWFSLAPMAAFGASFRWARNNLINLDCQSLEDNRYAEMDRLASQSVPGSNGILFLPYMIGERAPIWDPYARGVFFGLGLNTEKKDLLRAILEGTAYSLLHNVVEFEKAGFRLDRLLCTGGGAKSNLWKQIIADVLNREIITIENEDNVTLGNALLAGYGLGVYKNLKESIQSIVKIKDSYLPSIKNHEIYEQIFDIYCKLYLNTKDIFRELGEIKITL